MQNEKLWKEEGAPIDIQRFGWYSRGSRIVANLPSFPEGGPSGGPGQTDILATEPSNLGLLTTMKSVTLEDTEGLTPDSRNSFSGRRFEDGQLEVSPPPQSTHQAAFADLTLLIRVRQTDFLVSLN